MTNDSYREAIVLREFEQSDMALLQDMLLLAAFPPGVKRPDRSLVSEDPRLFQWLDQFGSRSGDIGIVAEAHGVEVGAAWCRLFTAYTFTASVGYINDDTPCVAIAVAEGHQNMGIGTELLRTLREATRDKGFPGLSLCVGESNPSIHLYERAGFERISKVGSVVTMRNTNL